MTGSSMQRTFKFSSTVAMILLGSCLSILSPTAIAQNEELQKEFQQALQEERSWAGLRSKTLKVGEVTGPTVKADRLTSPRYSSCTVFPEAVTTGTGWLII